MSSPLVFPRTDARIVADDGEEHVIPWDHRPLGWFLDEHPRPLGLLVEFGDDGLVVVGEEGDR